MVKKLFCLIDSSQMSSCKNPETIVVDYSPDEKVLTAGRKRYPKVKWIGLGRKNIGQGDGI